MDWKTKREKDVGRCGMMCCDTTHEKGLQQGKNVRKEKRVLGGLQKER